MTSGRACCCSQIFGLLILLVICILQNVEYSDYCNLIDHPGLVNISFHQTGKELRNSKLLPYNQNRMFTTTKLLHDIELNPEPNNYSTSDSRTTKINVKIAHLNVRSLKCREHYVLVKETILTNKFDIFTISETWLDNSVTDVEFEVPGYKLYRVDRENKKGGAKSHSDLITNDQINKNPNNTNNIWKAIRLCIPNKSSSQMIFSKDDKTLRTNECGYRRDPQELIKFARKKERLTQHQSGNKKWHSTKTSVIQTTDAILNAIDKKKLTATVFLDMSKAYLSNRKQVVKIHSTKSELLPVRNCETVKDLGVTLDLLLSYDEHINCVKHQVILLTLPVVSLAEHE
ncbi:Hypothetical predicted protein, partial [Paramuricea clavata]